MTKAQINSPELWQAKLPKAKPEDNKYTRGHLLINGSPIDCTGATKLAAFAAARAGAGMVTVASDEKALPIYQTSFMSIMAKPVKEPKDFYKYIDHRKVNTVLVGPGNGKNQDTSQKVLDLLQNKNLKLVLDADAISVFGNNKNIFLEGLKYHGNCIITPHVGEFGKVFDWVDKKSNKTNLPTNSLSLEGRGQFFLESGASLEKLGEGEKITPHPATPKLGELAKALQPSHPRGEGICRITSAQNAAKKSDAVIVLKGHETIIASPDGKVAINKNAPATLATGGTGDVLAGIISGLIAQNMPPFEAACAGVYIHSECANLLGSGMIAEDLIGKIPQINEEL